MAASTLPRLKRRAPTANPGQDTPADNMPTTTLTPAPVDIIDVPDADDKEKSSPDDDDSGREEHSDESDDDKDEEDDPPLEELITMASTRVADTERQLRKALARIVTLEATQPADPAAIAKAIAARDAALTVRDSAKISLTSLVSLRPQTTAPADTVASDSTLSKDDDFLPLKPNVAMPAYKRDTPPVEFITKMERRLINLIGAAKFNKYAYRYFCLYVDDQEALARFEAEMTRREETATAAGKTFEKSSQECKSAFIKVTLSDEKRRSLVHSLVYQGARPNETYQNFAQRLKTEMKFYSMNVHEADSFVAPLAQRLPSETLNNMLTRQCLAKQDPNIDSFTTFEEFCDMLAKMKGVCISKRATDEDPSTSFSRKRSAS
ncbi:hypothetical protein BGZ73_001673, partial [Actinomortierella ambigua]